MTNEHPETTEIGRVALFLPFVLVVTVMLLTGRRSAADLALAATFLAVPLAIGVLRSRAHRPRTT